VNQKTVSDLKDTHGCIRAFDEDVATMKSITDELQKNDSEEIPGKLHVVDDLIRDNGEYKLPDAGTAIPLEK
jgi:hypothetical protein